MEYLIDDEAVDVSRMTGYPWRWEMVHQRGVRHPFLDLRELDWWAKWRVMWSMVAGYNFTGGPNAAPQVDQFHS